MEIFAVFCPVSPLTPQLYSVTVGEGKRDFGGPCLPFVPFLEPKQNQDAALTVLRLVLSYSQ